MVVGAIIGVGIFFTPTGVARAAGSESLALWTWGFGGLIALLGALTFAELGALYPRAGAQYEILRDAYAAPVAFLYVFCNLTAIQAGAVAVIAIVCAQNLGVAVKGVAPSPEIVNVLAFVLILTLAGANCLGVRRGATIQNVTVLAKVLALLFVVALAAVAPAEAPPVASLDPPAPRPWLLAIFAGLVPAFFSFGGWQQALWMGGEVKAPERNVPRSIVVGVTLVVMVYLLVNWGYFRLLGYAGVAESQALAADAVSSVLSRWGSRLIAGAVAISAFGVLNAQFLTGPRLTYAMARDGRFFELFGRLHPLWGTPVPAILLLAGLAVVLLLAQVDKLLTFVVFIDGIFFALTGLSLPILRRHGPPGTARALRSSVVAALFVLGEGCVVVGAFQIPENRGATLVGAAWIIAALGIYAIFFRAPARTEPR